MYVTLCYSRLTTASSNGTLGLPYRADDIGLSDSARGEEELSSDNTGTGDGGTCVIQGLSCTDVRVGLDIPSQWLIGQFSFLGLPRWGPSPAAEHSTHSIPPSSHGIAVMLQVRHVAG